MHIYINIFGLKQPSFVTLVVQLHIADLSVRAECSVEAPFTHAPVRAVVGTLCRYQHHHLFRLPSTTFHSYAFPSVRF